MNLKSFYFRFLGDFHKLLSIDASVILEVVVSATLCDAVVTSLVREFFFDLSTSAFAYDIGETQINAWQLAQMVRWFVIIRAVIFIVLQHQLASGPRKSTLAVSS